jgi:O-antigen/teichoic acid export membrane protein
MNRFNTKYIIQTSIKLGLDRAAKSFALLSSLLLINYFFEKELATELNYLFAASLFFQVVLIQTYENVTLNSLRKNLFSNILISKFFFSILLYAFALINASLNPLSKEITFLWGALYLSIIILQSLDTIDYFAIAEGRVLGLALIRWTNFIFFLVVKFILLKKNADPHTFLIINVVETLVFYILTSVIFLKKINMRVKFLYVKIFYIKKVLFSFLISISAVVSSKIGTLMLPHFFYFKDINQYLTLSRTTDFFVSIVAIIPIAVTLTIHKEDSPLALRNLILKALIYIVISASVILILLANVFIFREFFPHRVVENFFEEHDINLLLVLSCKMFLVPIGGILGALWVKFKLLKLALLITVIEAVLQVFIVLISGLYETILIYAILSTSLAAFTTIVLPFLLKDFLLKLRLNHER